jgi:hypothetical protein
MLGHLGAIVHATGALADLVTWADELRRQNKVDAARAVIELAIGCGHAADVHQSAYLQVNKALTLRDDESYRATIDADERCLIEEELPLTGIAATLAEAAALMWPDLEEAIARAGAAGARRVPATSNAAAALMFPRLTTVLGTGAVMLYQHDTLSADIAVVAAATPIIILGPRLSAENSGGLSATAVRALVARAVEQTRPEHLVFCGLPPREATRLLTSVVRLFGPPALREAVSALLADEDVQRAYDEVIKGALPVKLRTRLEQLLASLAPEALDNARYTASCHRAADRAAVLVGGDATVVAADTRARGDTFEHLIRAVSDPRWFALRAKLGIVSR